MSLIAAVLRIPGHAAPFALSLLALTAQFAIAQPGGSVAGRVVDASTGQAVAAARVEIGTAWHATSGDDGTFRLERVTPGDHELIVRRLGYVPRKYPLRVSEGLNAPIEISINPAPAELPGVTVEAERGYLGGFWDRRSKGLGHFITRADIDRRKPVRVADMLRGVSGARVFSTDHGYAVGSNRGSREFSGGECIAAVFLNGVPYQMSSGGLNDIDPDHVEAIEYYSSGARVPTQFNSSVGGSRRGAGVLAGHPKCGVVAIWLRGRP